MHIEYEDLIPIEYRYGKFKRAFLEFLMTFNHKIYNGKTLYKKEPLKISSKYGEAHFSFYEKGFKEIIGKNFKLKRI